MWMEAVIRALRMLALGLALGGLQPAAGAVVTLDAAQVQAGHLPPQLVRLPHDWATSFPGHSGGADYRLRFDPPGGQEMLAVYIERACSNLEVRVNGEAIGSGGRMAPPVTRNCYHPQLFLLPRALLRAGSNELQVLLVGHAAGQVSSRQRAAGISAVQLGPLAELQERHDARRFWNVTAAQVIALSVGVLGLAMLALFAARRQDTALLYFGLFTVGWSLMSARLFVRDVPLPHVLLEVAMASAFPLVLACAYLFLMRLAGRRWPWVDRALWLQAAATPLVLVAAAPDRLLPAATLVYNLVTLEGAACAALFLRVSWTERRPDFWLIGSVLLVALLLGAAETALQNGLLPLPRIHLLHFAMPLIFAVIGGRLIRLFVQAMRTAETLNHVLEQRVEEKSREIARSWQQIAQLRSDQAAQDERRRIASDLHDDLGAQLLTIAQASQRGGEPERIAAMARRAMDEMRLSVRGLTGDSAHAAEVLADWRAETVTRLGDAGLQAEWQADEPADGLILPARTHVQLTRVLREAVSNAIRHSGGSRCAVRIRFPEGGLLMQIEDDGRGLAEATTGGHRGHGLPGIERRVRQLEGRHAFERPAGGGTRLTVQVPLATASTAAPQP